MLWPQKNFRQVDARFPVHPNYSRAESSTSHISSCLAKSERLPGAQPPAGPPKFKLHVTFIERSENLCHRGHFKRPISQPIMHSQTSYWAGILPKYMFNMGKLFLRQTNSQILRKSCLKVPIVIKNFAPSSAQFSLRPNYS